MLLLATISVAQVGMAAAELAGVTVMKLALKVVIAAETSMSSTAHATEVRV